MQYIKCNAFLEFIVIFLKKTKKKQLLFKPKKNEVFLYIYTISDSTIDLERGEARSDESDVKVKESKCEQEIVVRVTESDKPEIR